MIYFLNKIVLFTKCFLILVIASISSTSFGDQLNIKKIIINGEQRVSESFILNFLDDYPNKELRTQKDYQKHSYCYHR